MNSIYPVQNRSPAPPSAEPAPSVERATAEPVADSMETANKDSFPEKSKAGLRKPLPPFVRKMLPYFLWVWSHFKVLFLFCFFDEEVDQLKTDAEQLKALIETYESFKKPEARGEDEYDVDYKKRLEALSEEIRLEIDQEIIRCLAKIFTEKTVETLQEDLKVIKENPADNSLNNEKDRDFFLWALCNVSERYSEKSRQRNLYG